MFKMNATDINWNLHRDPVTNPIQQQKIDALLASFEKSRNEANEDGFWQTGLGVVLCHYDAKSETAEPFSAQEVADFLAAQTPGALLELDNDTIACLYAGHHRLEAAKTAGIEELVVVPEYMDLRQMQIRYILENGEEYGQNMQVLIENTAQSLGIIQGMLDSAEDYDQFIEMYGQDGQNLYSRNRFGQLKGDAVVSANDVVKLLGSEVSKKSIEAAYKVLADESAGIIKREDVFNFPTPRMMGIFGTIVAAINAMDAVPPAMRDFYKSHLIAEITGDLVRLPSDDDDAKFEAKAKKARAKGPRVTFSQLDGLRRTMTAAKKAATEAGDKFGIDLVQALKKAMGIKKEGDEAVEVAFNLKAALGSEKRCGARWQDLVDADGAVSKDVDGLTDFEGVPTALAEIDEKHKEKVEKDKKADAKGEGDELQEEVDAGADESGDELPPMEDAETVDPEQASQDAVASFSTAMETIDATMQNLARYHKLAAKSLEEPEVDALESIFVATAKVLWQIKGTRKDVETLLSNANPKS